MRITDLIKGSKGLVKYNHLAGMNYKRGVNRGYPSTKTFQHSLEYDTGVGEAFKLYLVKTNTTFTFLAF